MVVYHVKNSMWRRRVPAAAFSRRHLHQLSRASVANRDLLCACTSAGGSQPARRFSEAILKSTPVSAVTEALTQNELVFTVQDKLIAFHELSGLPWWATIVASTTAVRALLFPLAVHQQRVMAEWGAVHRQMETGAEAQIAAASAQLAKSERWDAETADSNYQCAIYDHRQELYRAHGCQPWKALVLPAVQLPVWVAMSAALHNIASMLPIRDAVAAQAYADMKATAVPLLADLTATDETAALALVVVVAQLLVIQLRDKIAFDQNPYRRTAFVVWRGATLGTYPFLILAPKCVTLYWLTSSLLAVLQNVLFVRTRTRQLLRIPSTERTNKDPFERLIHRLKKDDFKAQLSAAADKLVVVDFFAAWCGPCKFISPKVEELSAVETDVIFLKVDVDECEDIAECYKISSMPTFIFIKNGEPVESFSGANDGKLKEMVAKHK